MGLLTRQIQPHGVRRRVARMPIWLYRFRLGAVLGEGFLMLTHIGRSSGRLRQTVLGVLHHDSQCDTYVVASGWGERADWLRNVQHNPRILLDVGHRRIEATAMRLPTDRATERFVEYARQHPQIVQRLAKMALGRPIDGTPADCRALADAVPLVAIRPL